MLGQAILALMEFYHCKPAKLKTLPLKEAMFVLAGLTARAERMNHVS